MVVSLLWLHCIVVVVFAVMDNSALLWNSLLCCGSVVVCCYHGHPRSIVATSVEVPLLRCASPHFAVATSICETDKFVINRNLQTKDNWLVYNSWVVDSETVILFKIIVLCSNKARPSPSFTLLCYNRDIVYKIIGILELCIK